MSSPLASSSSERREGREQKERERERERAHRRTCPLSSLGIAGDANTRSQRNRDRRSCDAVLSRFLVADGTRTGCKYARARARAVFISTARLIRATRDFARNAARSPRIRKKRGVILGLEALSFPERGMRRAR